jgi:hypothetical protein
VSIASSLNTKKIMDRGNELMNNNNFITMGVMAGVALLTLLALLPDQDPIEKGPNFQDLIPAPDPNDHEAHMAYCVTPWGQIMSVFFSADQWEMLNQVSKMSGQDIDELICEIAAQRHEIGAGLEFPPEDPPF